MGTGGESAVIALRLGSCRPVMLIKQILLSYFGNQSQLLESGILVRIDYQLEQKRMEKNRFLSTWQDECNPIDKRDSSQGTSLEILRGCYTRIQAGPEEPSNYPTVLSKFDLLFSHNLWPTSPL